MKGQNVRTFKALSCLAAIFIGSSVLAQDFAGADGGDVVVLRLPISVNVRLKVGPKFFDFTAWEPADDHGMAGCEVEIAWEVLGQSQDQKQTLGLVVGLENSNLLIDHAVFDNAQRRRIRSIDSSLIVTN